MVNRLELMEVRPENRDGWYYTTIFVYNKFDDEDAAYIQEWFEFKNGAWDYGEWLDKAYVCFLHKYETNKPVRED